VTAESGNLYEFMPYGAPELKEVARRYLVRATMVGMGLWCALFLASYGGVQLLKLRPHETSVIVVPYRELAAPPPEFVARSTV